MASNDNDAKEEFLATTANSNGDVEPLEQEDAMIADSIAFNHRQQRSYFLQKSKENCRGAGYKYCTLHCCGISTYIIWVIHMHIFVIHFIL